jgi:hypothetical protein
VTSSAVQPPADPGLDRAEAEEVLRYWQALLRHEEALALRPRARRPGARAEGVNFAAPVAGQDYMKLAIAGNERFLLEQRGRVRLELDAERLGFFEHWLANRYRQAEEEERRISHLALFPVLHSPREELLGLLRFPVELRWWAGERLFEVPGPAQRRAPAGGLLPPSEIEIEAQAAAAGEGLPFFVDVRLLRETLRVDADELDAFFALARKEPAPTGPQVVAALCKLLSASIAAEAGATAAATAPATSTATDAAAAASLETLQRLLATRLKQLSSGYRTFPLALVVASDRSRTTWHVQRDLEQALELIEERGLRPETPLGAYLGGRAAAGRERVCLGRWPRAPLTTSQRAALEHALGTSFAAVQGPPGTGKTTVILNLVAHQLIEKLRALVEGGVMGGDFILVTSTNNRAVDNVVEPLSDEALSEVPLCLRLGHRALMEKVTLRSLERVHAWLQRQPAQADAVELPAAKQAFAAALARVDARTRAAHAAYERRALLATLHEARAELVRLGSPDGQREASERVLTSIERLAGAGSERARAPDASWRKEPKPIALAVAALIRVLDQLAEQCESATPAALARVTALHARLRQHQLGVLSEALGAEVALQAPPAPASIDDWADAVASSLGPLVALQQALERLAEAEQAGERLHILEARIAELSAEPSNPAPEQLELSAEDEAADFEELFRRALALRTAWLREQRAPLLTSLEHAIVQCKNLRSLRSLLDSPKAAGSWLRQLFPSLGCTLLSLGNALRADQPSCRQVVIDEAGQCPQAYAVSALLRARSALFLGDTHQLEPVVGLSREDERRIARGLKLKLPPARLSPYQMFDESGNSAQSLADRAAAERPTLRDHFRCQPEIIRLPEVWCNYGMLVRTPPRSRSAQAPRLAAAALFQHCPGTQERFAGSWVNTAEIEQVVAWLGYLLQQGILPGDVGVITPFRSQSEALARRLSAARIPLARGLEEEEGDGSLELFAARELRGGVAVGTVHRFQGGERSIIVLSSTLTRAANLRFVDERVNLLNVAVSRAKEHLLVIGHAETLRAGRHTRLLVTETTPVQGF